MFLLGIRPLQMVVAGHVCRIPPSAPSDLVRPYRLLLNIPGIPVIRTAGEVHCRKKASD